MGQNECSVDPEIGDTTISNSGWFDSAAGRETQDFYGKENIAESRPFGRKGCYTSIATSIDGIGW